MTRPTHDQIRHTHRDEETDQNLLLLAHGALPFWTRLRVQAHLRRCAGCRKRLLQLTQASALLADAVRGPSLPAWSRSQASTRAAKPVFRGPALVAALAVLTLLILGAAFFLTKALAPAPPHATSAPSTSAPSAAGGCRPDLPNSRCR